MIIHVKKRDNPFVQIDKRALNDDRLSWKARGLLSYLLSKPPDWQVWIKDLVNRSQKDGETAIRSALKELKKWGYMQEHQSRMENGTFGPVEYWVYEEPLGGFPQADKPDAVEPKAEKPQPENQGHINNDSTKNQSTDNEENKKQPVFPEKPKEQTVKLRITREKAKPRVVVPDEVDQAAIEAIMAQEQIRKERTDEQETANDCPAGRDRRNDDLGVCDGEPIGMDSKASALPVGLGVDDNHTLDPIVEAITEQTETRPGPLEVAARTAAAQAAVGNHAVPVSAGGDDAMAHAGLIALHKAKGGSAPREGTGTYVKELEAISRALRDRGVTDPRVAVLAAQMFVEEKPKLACPHYKSFVGDYGEYLGRACSQPNGTLDRHERYDTPSVRASQAAWEERKAARGPPVEDCRIGAAIKRELELQMSGGTFETWVKPCAFACDDGALVVTAVNAFTKDWLEDRLATTIKQALVGFLEDAPQEVRFEVVE